MSRGLLFYPGDDYLEPRIDFARLRPMARVDHPDLALYQKFRSWGYGDRESQGNAAAIARIKRKRRNA